MSKEIDNLLDNLIKEIGEEVPETETKPASQEAARRAEVIAKDVNKSYRRPPEPVKQSIPAPQLKKVVEPEPTSHFSSARPQDPAIRMHDRLDESSLPAPDADRRPTRIIDNKKNQRSIPAPAEAPKRKIPHISIPDELPPDVQPAAAVQEKQDSDPEREALVKSRAEKIREQLKKRTLEETPIIPPPSEEEIDDMINDLENPDGQAKADKENGSIFSYLHQVLGVEEEPEEPEDDVDASEDEEGGFARWFDEEPEQETASFQSTESSDDEDYEEDFSEDELYDDEDDAPRFRHLEDEEEIEERKENRLIAFFRGLFRKRTAEADEHDFESGEFDDEYEDEDFEDDPFAEEDYEETEEPEEEFEQEETLTEETPEESSEPESEEPEAADASEESEEDDVSGEEASEAEEPADDEDFTEDEPEEEFQRTEKKHSRFFSEAFDESAEELAEMKAEPDPRPAQDADIKNRFLGRNSYFVAGIIVLLLALVGLVTFISGVVKAAGGFFSGGSLKNQLEQALYPVAVVDVPSFNEPAELTAEGALSAAIVDILMHDDLSGYTETFDMISVPAEDVLERGRQMFGVDVQTQLDTLHAAGESFVYDAQSNCFNVPVEPMIFSYSPEVIKIQRNGDTYEVTVAYHRDVAKWEENSRTFRATTTKNMQATIEKKSTGYRIVRLVPAN